MVNHNMLRTFERKWVLKQMPQTDQITGITLHFSTFDRLTILYMYHDNASLPHSGKEL